MASITKHNGGWRAQVYVKGERDSKTFRTRDEAKAWANRREVELGGATGDALTFAVVAQEWLDWWLPQLQNDKNVTTVEGSVRTWILPEIGHLRLADIRRTHLVEVVRKVEKAGKIETAHRVGQRIAAILDRAVDLGQIASHPGAHLSRVLTTRKKVPQPAISAEQLPKLLADISRYSDVHARYERRARVTRLGMLLMAHTFLRTSELIGGRWSELLEDGRIWFVPAERMKRKILPHVVPLSKQAQAILAELQEINADSPFMLASPSNPAVPISDGTILQALYRMGYKGVMCGHGFRAVASTILNESRQFYYKAIERQLAHGETDQVKAAYDRAEHLDERRRLMAWWGDYLEEASKKGSSVA